MPEITNNTTDVLDFRVQGKHKDGIVPTESVGPGETKNIDVVETPRYRAAIRKGTITVKGRAAQKAEAPAPSTRPASSK